MIERFQFYIKHSINDLRVNGRRTLFALLCIAAGVAAIVSLQTLGVMIDDTLVGSLQEVNKGDIQIRPGIYFQVDDDEMPATSEDFDDFVDRAEQQREQDGIIAEGGRFTAPYFTEDGLEKLHDWLNARYPGTEITYQQNAQISGNITTAISISAPAQGTSELFVIPYIIDAEAYPLYGERLSLDDKSLDAMLREPTNIVISENLADSLEVAVGDTIRISGASADFELTGIVPTVAEGGFDNVAGALLGYYYLDFEARQFFPDMIPAGDVVFVRLGDPSQTVEAAEAIDNQYLYMDTTSTQDVLEMNEVISSNLNDMVTIMGLVSLLIGGIGIINTMLVIVSRRANEVAVLKTLGLEPEEVTLLFMVEAILMGIIGSIGGIALGWLLAYATKGVAERFLAQSLAFRFALEPALTGFVVGVLVTTIFGFLPTLVAGQVRPAIVLRPSDNVMPRAGRILSFGALLVVIIALSLLTRGLVGELLTSDSARQFSAVVGAIFGVLLALSMLIGGMFRAWTRTHIIIRIITWNTVSGVLGVAGAGFGYYVPALLVVAGTGIIIFMLYAVLWLLIWAIGGGRFTELPMLSWLSPTPAHEPQKQVNPILALPLLGWRLTQMGIAFIVLLLILPFWLFGLLLRGLNTLLERIGLVDLKVAMRSMVASKGRGASTLLALVVGVFTLSVITMLVDTVTIALGNMLENEMGGNVMLMSIGGGDQVAAQLETIMAEMDGIESYALISSYDTQLVSMQDQETGRTYSLEELEQRSEDAIGDDGWLDGLFSTIDGRDVGSNLPEVNFYDVGGVSRQLRPTDAGQPVIIVPANEATLAAGFSVGDLLTFNVGRGEQITFTIVGMVDRRSGDIQVGSSQVYAPRDAFPDTIQPSSVFGILEVEEDRIKELRRRVSDIEGVFMLETRVINDLLNRLVDQFTSFPTLVAGLALFTGGIVIANSVALSMMERRREIGIMKAVGVQRERVLAMLLLENALMGFVGGLIGVGISFVVLVIMLTTIFQGELGNVIPYGTAFTLMVLCIGIALVAALFSVWGASGEKPLNVLRYE